MRFLSPKMHQIQARDPARGAYSASLAGGQALPKNPSPTVGPLGLALSIPTFCSMVPYMIYCIALGATNVADKCGFFALLHNNNYFI